MTKTPMFKKVKYLWYLPMEMEETANWKKFDGKFQYNNLNFAEDNPRFKPNKWIQTLAFYTKKDMEVFIKDSPILKGPANTHMLPRTSKQPRNLGFDFITKYLKPFKGPRERILKEGLIGLIVGEKLRR